MITFNGNFVVQVNYNHVKKHHFLNCFRCSNCKCNPNIYFATNQSLGTFKKFYVGVLFGVGVWDVGCVCLREPPLTQLNWLYFVNNFIGLLNSASFLPFNFKKCMKVVQSVTLIWKITNVS